MPNNQFQLILQFLHFNDNSKYDLNNPQSYTPYWEETKPLEKMCQVH